MLMALIDVAHEYGAVKEVEKVLKECGVVLKIVDEDEKTDNDENEAEEACSAQAMLKAIKELADKCETIEELRKSLKNINA